MLCHNSVLPNAEKKPREAATRRHDQTRKRLKKNEPEPATRRPGRKPKPKARNYTNWGIGKAKKQMDKALRKFHKERLQFDVEANQKKMSPKTTKKKLKRRQQNCKPAPLKGEGKRAIMHRCRSTSISSKRNDCRKPTLEQSRGRT